MPISKTKIDRLGDRLKADRHTDDDLRLLDDYRRSFADACESVVRAIRERGEAPTARLAKSTLSIAEKLRRESVRLSQMQDIAGCRVVVADIIRQDQFVETLKTTFPAATIVDRRANPSYGYRAVHVIVEISERPVEVQVRTALQHLWAEVSEKLADVVDPEIKYGGGPDACRLLQQHNSDAVASCEALEKRVSEQGSRNSNGPSNAQAPTLADGSDPNVVLALMRNAIAQGLSALRGKLDNEGKLKRQDQ
jgi:putative GTP pyrophosphokinase